jgi:hypothetical protein
MCLSPNQDVPAVSRRRRSLANIIGMSQKEKPSDRKIKGQKNGFPPGRTRRDATPVTVEIVQLFNADLRATVGFVDT